MTWLIELEFKPQIKWITSIKLRNMSMTYQWMTEGQVGSLVFVVAPTSGHTRPRAVKVPCVRCLRV